jgi:hypothetical protein
MGRIGAKNFSILPVKNAKNWQLDLLILIVYCFKYEPLEMAAWLKSKNEKVHLPL